MGHSIVRLAPFTSDQRMDDALEVYARTWPERDRDEARENFTRYAGYRDFHGLVAYLASEPIGLAYGARSYAGVWWHDQVTPVFGEDHPELQDAWRLVELAVIEPQRGGGLGGRLHDEIIGAQPCPRLLVCTSVANTRARAIYEHRGWHYLSEDFYFEGAGQYVIMARER